MALSLDEARKTLDDVETAKVWQTQQRGLMRLLLYITGRTHELINEYAQQARLILIKQADARGALNGLGLQLARNGLDKAWGQTFEQWKALLEAGRREGARIPFGSLVVLHREMVTPATALNEHRHVFHEDVSEDVFASPVKAVLDAATQRIYSDGLHLSQRIWRFDHQSRDGIRSTLYNGVAEGQSAWEIAGELETYLGGGANCPRWTRTRLYRLSKAEIAGGDQRGLLSGEDCDARGVAYNALRLARNEIQIAHHAATDEIMRKSPFIAKEQIHLSPGHAEKDVCDKVIARGEGGRGIYAKGKIKLPLHVHCLCYKTAVLMKPDAFADQMRGWLKGNTWAEMDEYQQFFGGNVRSPINSVLAQALAVWAFANVDDLTEAIGV